MNTELESEDASDTSASFELMSPFMRRMADDSWAFGVDLTDGRTIGVAAILGAYQRGGVTWIEFEMLDRRPHHTAVGKRPVDLSPTSRTTLAVNAQHIVALYELADT